MEKLFNLLRREYRKSDEYSYTVTFSDLAKSLKLKGNVKSIEKRDGCVIIHTSTKKD